VGRLNAVTPKFSSHLQLAMLPGQDGHDWVLASDFSYRAKSGTTYQVLAGFHSDGASIPRVFWRLIGPPLAGRYAPAALIHDGLYASEIIPRDVADDLFLEMMETLGVKSWRRKLMYQAVRIGGGAVWKKHTPTSVTYANKFVEVEEA
jgi:hypothetical protein